MDFLVEKVSFLLKLIGQFKDLLLLLHALLSVAVHTTQSGLKLLDHYPSVLIKLLEHPWHVNVHHQLVRIPQAERFAHLLRLTELILLLSEHLLIEPDLVLLLLETLGELLSTVDH